jgi:probable HAF family extracellular repeat protein
MHTSRFLIALAALAAPAAAQATFTPVGPAAEAFTGASKTGVWHAAGGFSANESWIWSAGSGPILVPTLGNSAFVDVTADGLTLAGTWKKPNGDTEAGIVVGGVTTFLGNLGAQSGTSVTSFYSMNDAGTAVVGLAWVTAGQAHGFKWTPGGGMQDLGSFNPTRSSRANGVSEDGNVVVGWDEHTTGYRRPCYWVGATEFLIADLPGEAWGTNADGSVIVGILEDELFRFDTINGPVKLGKLPGSVGGDDAYGVSVSADGNTIVGYNGNSFFGTPFRAFVWRPGSGMVVLEDLLVALGAANAAGANLSFAYNVSADGRTISGATGGFPQPTNGFVATLPEVADVYCTAKVNSAGCTPAIAFAGTPSASSGTGFVIFASQVMASSSGLLMYSKTGPAAVPFFGGLLCLGGQITRTPGQFSGGTTGCTGALAFEFNAYVAGGADPLLVGGADVWAQYWYRDAGFAPPNNADTTDAVAFTLWP